MSFYDGDLVILDVDEILRVVYDGCRIGGDEELVVPDSDYHGAALSGSDDLVRIAFFQNADRISAYNLPKRDAHSFLQRTAFGVLHILDKVHKHFGVGIGAESVSAAKEGILEDAIVLDDSVVDQGQPA